CNTGYTKRTEASACEDRGNPPEIIHLGALMKISRVEHKPTEFWRYLLFKPYSFVSDHQRRYLFSVYDVKEAGSMKISIPDQTLVQRCRTGTIQALTAREYARFFKIQWPACDRRLVDIIKEKNPDLTIFREEELFRREA
ncbi:MAG TPA: hypothetical protein VJH22_03020, partial [Candidatus Nanoarchaeia archaeon]|nr:hypothetical protein [Candidatus Nanoarchaeia archaeon]